MPFLTKLLSFGENRSWSICIEIQHANFYTVMDLHKIFIIKC